MADFPKACHDMLHWDELLTDKERQTKYKVRKFMASHNWQQLKIAAVLLGNVQAKWQSTNHCINMHLLACCHITQVTCSAGILGCITLFL